MGGRGGPGNNDLLYLKFELDKFMSTGDCNN